MLNKLSRDLLISSYKKAKMLNLDSYFIFLLETEIQKRRKQCKENQKYN